MATATWPLENGQETITKKHPDRFRTSTPVFVGKKGKCSKKEGDPWKEKKGTPCMDWSCVARHWCYPRWGNRPNLPWFRQSANMLCNSHARLIWKTHNVALLQGNYHVVHCEGKDFYRESRMKFATFARWSGNSQWRLSNGAWGHSLQFLHNRLQWCTFVALLGPFLRGTFVANDDNRRQSWTIVDKYLKPPFAKPTFRLPQDNCFRKKNLDISAPKKKFSPPKKNSPIFFPQTPSRPLAPSPWRPAPLLGFSIKNRSPPPPSRHLADQKK